MVETRRATTSTALELLRDSVGDGAEVLDYLPFDKVEVQDQGEMPLAIRKAILVGTGRTKGPASRRTRVWAYLCRKSYSIVFHTYYPSGKPGGVLITDDVLPKMVPHEAFHFATDPTRLLVLATYYFMKIVVEPADNLVLNRPQRSILLSICRDIQGAATGSYLATTTTSKVVVLHVRVPKELLESTARYDKQAGRHSRPYRQDDSGIEDMDSERGETVQSLNSDEPIVPWRQEQTQGDSTATKLSVDRYLFLECQEKSLQQELELYGDRMQRTRERMAELEEVLNKELDEVNVLAARQQQCDVEKKRLWDTMSKEDFREMGRRDVEKRQKMN